MKYMYTKNIYRIILIVTIVLLSSVITGGEVFPFEDIEESAHTVLDSDEVITGKMDKFSKNMIIVDGTSYSLCKEIMVYNTADMLIALNDIEAALVVKLFRNKGCVRKIAVLSFAH